MKDLERKELAISGGLLPYPLIIINLRNLPIGEDLTLGDLIPPPAAE